MKYLRLLRAYWILKTKTFKGSGGRFSWIVKNAVQSGWAISAPTKKALWDSIVYDIKHNVQR